MGKDFSLLKREETLVVCDDHRLVDCAHVPLLLASQSLVGRKEILSLRISAAIKQRRDSCLSSRLGMS